MSFLKIIVETPDTCQSIKDKIIPTGDARVNQVMLNCANYLERVVMGGVLNSADSVAICPDQAEGTITFNGLLADDTITINGTAAPTGEGAGPDLGAAAPFASLAGSTLTNTGASVLTGDLGLSPGTSVTGFPPGTVTGTQHINDATAAQAKLDTTAAYNDLAGRTPTANLTGQDLGTLTLNAGIYKFNTSAQLTGTLVLDGQNNPNAVFVFQMGSTLTTAAASVVSLINGASADNVFWQVGSSATIGTTTDMQGTIIAQASITMNTGATLTGRTLAQTGAVTLDTNDITVPTVVPPPLGSGTTFTAKVAPVGLYEFALGANDTAAAANAVAKINAIMSNLVTASSVANVITITSVEPGNMSNAIVISSSNNTRATVVTMAGGSDGILLTYIK